VLSRRDFLSSTALLLAASALPARAQSTSAGFGKAYWHHIANGDNHCGSTLRLFGSGEAQEDIFVITASGGCEDVRPHPFVFPRVDGMQKGESVRRKRIDALPKTWKALKTRPLLTRAFQEDEWRDLHGDDDEVRGLHFVGRRKRYCVKDPVLFGKWARQRYEALPARRQNNWRQGFSKGSVHIYVEAHDGLYLDIHELKNPRIVKQQENTWPKSWPRQSSISKRGGGEDGIKSLAAFLGEAEEGWAYIRARYYRSGVLDRRHSPSIHEAYRPHLPSGLAPKGVDSC